MSWRGITGLRTSLLVLLGGGISAAVLCGVALGNRLRVLDRMEDGTATLNDATRADDFVQATAALLVVIAITTGIVWIVWQWRAAKNVEAYASYGTRFSPTWSIWGWIIPCASLVIPVLTLNDLWRASEPSTSVQFAGKRRGSVLIGVWWAAFLIASFAGRGLSTGSDDSDVTIASVRSADQTALFGMVLTITAAILAMFVVVQLTDRLEAMRAAGPATTPVVGPAPGWYTDPAGRFQHRYWNGAQWTENVSTAGVAGVDPMDGSAASRFTV
jgi:hypothetical protein